MARVNRGCRSTRRIASTAKPATSKTPSKTSTGSYRKVAAGRITRTCRHYGLGLMQTVKRLKTPAGTGIAAIAAALLLMTGTVAAPAAPNPPAAEQPTLPDHLSGYYLAGKNAQAERDFGSAVQWYEKALKLDPNSPELISRTFLMEISVGNFDRARELAPKELKLDPSDAMPQLVLLVTKLKAGDKAAALKAATALPQDGLHRFV